MEGNFNIAEMDSKGSTYICEYCLRGNEVVSVITELGCKSCIRICKNSNSIGRRDYMYKLYKEYCKKRRFMKYFFAIQKLERK